MQPHPLAKNEESKEFWIDGQDKQTGYTKIAWWSGSIVMEHHECKKIAKMIFLRIEMMELEIMQAKSNETNKPQNRITHPHIDEIQQPAG